MKITTFDPKKRTYVLCGDLEDGVFYKTVSPKHFMKISQSYGIQEDIIRELFSKRCRKIVLKTRTGDLESDFKEWLKPNIKVQDYGHGKQRFFPEKLMKRVSTKHQEKDNGKTIH